MLYADYLAEGSSLEQKLATRLQTLDLQRRRFTALLANLRLYAKKSSKEVSHLFRVYDVSQNWYHEAPLQNKTKISHCVLSYL